MIRISIVAGLISAWATGSANGAEDGTAFKGLAVGMKKVEIQSKNIEGFKSRYVPSQSGDGFYVPGEVQFISSSGETCAVAFIDKDDYVKRLKLQECLFGSKGAKAKDFAQQFADSYHIEKMTGSRLPKNKAIEEKYEGRTRYGESVTISAITFSGFTMPVEVTVEAPLKGAVFN